MDKIWHFLAKDAAPASLLGDDHRGIGGHNRVLEWNRGSVRPVHGRAAAHQEVNSDALQHSDHCWLTVHGVDWAIAMMKDCKILLWRGFEPNIEGSRCGPRTGITRPMQTR